MVDIVLIVNKIPKANNVKIVSTAFIDARIGIMNALIANVTRTAHWADNAIRRENANANRVSQVINVTNVHRIITI